MTGPTGRCSRWWGIGDPDAVFHGGDRIVCPWPSARRLKGQPLVAPDTVATLLAGGPYLTDVDPRRLRCTQTWVLHQHLTWYLTGEWERTGTTSADRGKAHNRYPLIYEDQWGELVILAGHHRSMAALVEGRPVRARVLRPAAATSVAVLPNLLVADPATVPFRTTVTDNAGIAADIVASGKTAGVEDVDLARATLGRLGFREEVITDRLTMAIEGRTLLSG